MTLTFKHARSVVHESETKTSFLIAHKLPNLKNYLELESKKNKCS